MKFIFRNGFSLDTSHSVTWVFRMGIVKVGSVFKVGNDSSFEYISIVFMGSEALFRILIIVITFYKHKRVSFSSFLSSFLSLLFE